MQPWHMQSNRTKDFQTQTASSSSSCCDSVTFQTACLFNTSNSRNLGSPLAHTPHALRLPPTFVLFFLFTNLQTPLTYAFMRRPAPPATHQRTPPTREKLANFFAEVCWHLSMDSSLFCQRLRFCKIPKSLEDIRCMLSGSTCSTVPQPETS